MESIGAVVLAGGMSLRMGKDKALLRLEGRTFLERISSELKGFEERLLSIDVKNRYESFNLTPVEDVFPGIGPIGGLYSALRSSRSEWLLAVSCDMPMFNRALADYMVSFISNDYDACVVVTRDGRIQPLCALYAKPVVDLLEEQILLGKYSLIQALSSMKVRYISLHHSIYPDEVVSNINNAEEYAALLRQIQGPPIIAVCGVKNSGKTTVICRLLPHLHARGLRVAVVKHDGHHFEPDVPGTDSNQIRCAGAQGVAVYSDHRFMIVSEQPDASPEWLARQFSWADLVLLEGGKESYYTKLEIVRKGVSEQPVCEPGTLLGLCSDMNMHLPGVPLLGMQEYESIADLIINWLHSEGLFPRIV
jgi:molybdopterin-guanine dinucleotide biosynthesis protein MobB